MGGRTVAEAENSLSSRELSEWIAFARIYPLPDPWRIGGQICSTMASLWSSGTYRPEDFIPGGGVVEQTPEETLSRFTVFAAANDRRIERGES